MNKEEKLERMRSGAWLHAIDPEIGEELHRAEELCFRLNALPPSRREEREALVRELLGATGRLRSATMSGSAATPRFCPA